MRWSMPLMCSWRACVRAVADGSEAVEYWRARPGDEVSVAGAADGALSQGRSRVGRRGPARVRSGMRWRGFVP